MGIEQKVTKDSYNKCPVCGSHPVIRMAVLPTVTRKGTIYMSFVCENGHGFVEKSSYQYSFTYKEVEDVGGDRQEDAEFIIEQLREGVI